ncbi:MAG TPA: alpha/beta hydrolase, partial [Phycisphaerae bacterium]
ESLIPRLLKPNPAPDLPQKLRTLMSPQSPDAVIAAQTAMANRPDQTDLLPHVNIPALIIVGIHDIITPPSAAQTLHQIPNSQLLQIQNAGHMTPLEAPDSVNTAIEKFAAGI